MSYQEDLDRVSKDLGDLYCTFDDGLRTRSFERNEETGILEEFPIEAFVEIARDNGVKAADLIRKKRVHAMNVGMVRLVVTGDGSVWDPRFFRSEPSKSNQPSTCWKNPERFISTAVNAQWDPDWRRKPNPIAQGFREGFDDDETADFFFSWFITGLLSSRRYKLVMFLFNPNNDTGKTVYCDLLKLLVGSYGVTVSSNLLDRRRDAELFRTLYREQYSRVAFIDEIGPEIQVNQAAIKLLTGEASLPSPYARTTREWVPPRMIIVNTNRLFDQRQGRDLESRTFALPFGVRKPATDRNPRLFDALATEENLDVFFSFLVEGYFHG